MRLMIVCLAAVLAAASLPAAPVAAQSAEQGPATPSPVRTELARQYLNLLMTDQFEGVVRQMPGSEFQTDSDLQAVPETARRMIMERTPESTTGMGPRMLT